MGLPKAHDVVRLFFEKLFGPNTGRSLRYTLARIPEASIEKWKSRMTAAVDEAMELVGTSVSGATELQMSVHACFKKGVIGAIEAGLIGVRDTQKLEIMIRLLGMVYIEASAEAKKEVSS